MRIVFAGTPDVAVPTLRALVEAGHEIVLVLTREDAPQGRKRVLTPSQVAVAAVELGLPVLKANRVTDGVIQEIREHEAELGVVVAYGALLDSAALAAPDRGWINLHFSLLPAWRGAAPVQHNLIHGGPLGVSVFQLDTGVDTGAVWAQARFEVSNDSTAGDVLAQFSVAGAEVVVEAIALLARGGQPTPQSGEASRAPKLTSEDGELRASDSAVGVYARYRGVTPEPGAWIADGGTRIKVLECRVHTRDVPPGEFVFEDRAVLWGTSAGSIELIRVQPSGKNAMTAADWFRGRR